MEKEKFITEFEKIVDEYYDKDYYKTLKESETRGWKKIEHLIRRQKKKG